MDLIASITVNIKRGKVQQFHQARMFNRVLCVLLSQTNTDKCQIMQIETKKVQSLIEEKK